MRSNRSAFSLGIVRIAVAVSFLAGVSQAVISQSPSTPLPPPQKPVNYAEPRREYETMRAGNFSFAVERQLADEDPDLAHKTIARLAENLREALKLMPSTARRRLGKLTYFLLYGPKSKAGGRDNGLEYYQRDAPSYHRDLDPRWSDCIVIYSAENYMWLSDLWALKALVHELAHAFHLEQWPENQTDILRAWRNAISQGLYQGVKDDAGKTVERAYATVNQLEYFAELSCMYFARSNYQPFNRAGLRSYDPSGCAMVEKMWGIHP